MAIKLISCSYRTVSNGVDAAKNVDSLFLPGYFLSAARYKFVEYFQMDLAEFLSEIVEYTHVFFVGFVKILQKKRMKGRCRFQRHQNDVISRTFFYIHS